MHISSKVHRCRHASPQARTPRTHLDGQELHIAPCGVTPGECAPLRSTVMDPPVPAPGGAEAAGEASPVAEVRARGSAADQTAGCANLQP